MAFLVVVRRDDPDLSDYLQDHFQEPEVQVMLDRRHGERRRNGGPVENDRRHTERRAIPADEDPLWRYGFRVSVARLWPGPADRPGNPARPPRARPPAHARGPRTGAGAAPRLSRLS